MIYAFVITSLVEVELRYLVVAGWSRLFPKYIR